MKLLLYPHGGSGNHGCEALVRSTVKLTGANAVLSSSAPKEDVRYGLDECCTIIKDRVTYKRTSASYLQSAFRFHLMGDKEAFDRMAFSPLFEAADGCDCALSIGGDNYCYDEPELLYLVNRELRKRNIRTVLWGCSVEPESIKGNLLDDLEGYERIIARESLTFNALKSAGLKRSCLFPDPAFALDRRQTVLPKGFVEGNTVGINVSPMIMSYESTGGAVLDSFKKLIDWILHETDMTVALIPHVVWHNNDDRKPLKQLYGLFKDSGRVIRTGDRPAEEIKDVIARCRFMVASRTHACIAAYSSQVPTLALGYSVKAEGIATDIMPEDCRFVVPVADLRDDQSLLDAFRSLISREKDIKEHLAAFMPDYIGRLSSLSL